MSNLSLIIPDWIALTQVLSHIHDESKCKIKDNRRPESDKGSIDKKQPDAGSSHPQLLTQTRAYPKGIAFKKMLDPIN